MKKVKACMPFYFETYLNNGFVLFFRQFWAVRKFLRSWSETEQLTVSDKKMFLAYQPRSKGTFLLYRGNICIKKSCNYSASIIIEHKFLHSSMLLSMEL